MQIKDKYCLPVIKKTKAEVLQTIKQNETNYGAFEVWLDYIDDFDADLLKMLSDFDKQIVVTLRRKGMQETKMSQPRRDDVIKTLSNSKHMLDLDIAQQEDIMVAKSQKIEDKLIISFHDYNRTPEDIYLAKIVDKIRHFKPKIIKIATMCQEPSDALRLLKLKRDFLENAEKHIVLGMGEHGKITRVFGALWGNELVFIPEDKSESSAPGQITRSEMDNILDRISNE